MLQEASDEPFYRYSNINIVSFRVEVLANMHYPSHMEMFIYGLGAGLIIACIVAFALSLKIGRINDEKNKEVQKYKNMLADRMELEADGLRKVKEENEELKKQNENLRVSLLALRDKPGRKEMQRLQILQKAADRLTINSPGFGPVWQAALKESEDEFQKVYSGFIPFIKRHIPKPTDAEVVDVQERVDS